MKPLLNHTSMETAYVVNDYPYGFRLRCKIRYWIEHSKTHGFRHVSQTTNPKKAGEVWNKPKPSTYAKIALAMFLDEKEHVTFRALSEYSNCAESKAFLEKYGACLNKESLTSLNTWIKLKEVYEAARDRGDIYFTINGQRV